jgi:hypothetical protein
MKKKPKFCWLDPYRQPGTIMNRTVICGDHSLVCLDVKDIFGTVAIKVNKIRMFRFWLSGTVLCFSKTQINKLKLK